MLYFFSDALEYQFTDRIIILNHHNKLYLALTRLIWKIYSRGTMIFI